MMKVNGEKSTAFGYQNKKDIKIHNYDAHYPRAKYGTGIDL